ncbi:MAG TPA: hypothetical protein VFG69_17560, partial [Nannocystaceae bacterium]|nr:hypothetical protein [Nannocystaceae bacterium]
ATREALTRLLSSALAIEERADLGDDARAFVRDAIALLTADLETPSTADDLAVRTLAYRTLATDGHARVRDNAEWRLYDHVRGTLAGAIAAPPEARTDVAVQVLYAEREDLAAELGDGPIHERPPWVGAAAVELELERHRDALAELPAWAKVVSARAPDDDELGRTVLATLPAARDAAWAVPLRPRGTGVAESLAPVLRVAGGQAEVDAGRPQHRSVALAEDVEPLAAALRATLAQDGRGVVLLAADPELDPTELRRVLRAVRRAHAARIEIALREPHANESVGTVVTALPLEIVHGRGDGAGALAIAGARVHAHVAARGVVFTHDGRVLQTAARGADEIAAMVERVGRAYPRERTLRITIADDAPLGMLVDLLVSTIGSVGGVKPRLSAVGWLADDAAPKGSPSAAADKVLQTRAELASSRASVRIDQPFPLAGDDQGRLRAFAEQLWRCMPELETPVAPTRTIELSLVFEGGRPQTVTVKPIAKVAAGKQAALASCIEDEAFALRLREHRDRLTIGIGLVGKP